MASDEDDFFPKKASGEPWHLHVFGFKPMESIKIVFPRLIFLPFLKSSWLSTWQGEEHGSGRQAQLLAGEAGHPWSQWQRSSPGLWDVERFKTRLWRRVNYLAVEVQDIARRCIAAEPPILIENNYEFPFFPYWIDIQIPFNSPAGCLAGGRPPLLMRALSCRGRSHFAPAKSSDQVVMGFIIKNSSAALENCFHIYALFCWFFCHNRRFLHSRSKKCNQNVPNEGGGFLNNVQRNCRLGHGGRP